jgi:hypothetical protein
LTAAPPVTAADDAWAEIGKPGPAVGDLSLDRFPSAANTPGY